MEIKSLQWQYVHGCNRSSLHHRRMERLSGVFEGLLFVQLHFQNCHNILSSHELRAQFQKAHFLCFPLVTTAAWLWTETQLIFFVGCLCGLMMPLSVPHNAFFCTGYPQVTNRCLCNAPRVSQTSWYWRHRLKSVAAKWLLTPSRVSG